LTLFLIIVRYFSGHIKGQSWTGMTHDNVRNDWKWSDGTQTGVKYNYIKHYN